MTFLRILRADRLLAVTFVVLVLLGLYPLTQTSMLPFIDMNLTAGHGAMMFSVMDADHPLAAFYQIHWSPVPYWTSYLLTALADALGGTVFAAKALPGLLVISLPAATIRLLHALKRDPRLGLWAFMFNWERNLWAGWTAYLLGMTLALVALAWLIESDRVTKALKVTVLAAVVALTHIQALAFLALAGAVITLSERPRLRRLALHTLALSGGLLAIAPWLVDVGLFRGGDARTTSAFKLIEHTPDVKMAKLFEYTFDVFSGEFTSWIPALLFLCLLLGPLLIATVGKRLRHTPLAASLAVLLAATLLYLVLPYAIAGALVHKHNYVRYASFILLGALFVPRTRLRGKFALALVPGIVCAMAMDLHTARHFRVFDQHTHAFTELFGSMPAGSRLLPIITERKDPTCKMAPMGGFHGILAGHDRAFDPHYFRTAHIPVNYRNHQLPPPPQISPGSTRSTKFRKLLLDYDFVLIQGLARDPFLTSPANTFVRPIKKTGIWQLYAIDHAAVTRALSQPSPPLPRPRAPVRPKRTL